MKRRLFTPLAIGLMLVAFEAKGGAAGCVQRLAATDPAPPGEPETTP